MRICIIGPGMMPIPPTGWGAVEILIWDLKQTLEQFGHEVLIVNTTNRHDMVTQTNEFQADFVHIHYDEYFDIEQYLNCDNIAITSHYGYLEQPHRYDGGYWRIINGFLRLKRAKIFALSPGIANQYVQRGFPENKVCVVPNGVRTDLFNFADACEFPDKSLYLAKIEPRKRQSWFHNIPDLYFAGNNHDGNYNGNNYLGEWSKETLYSDLTKYANLALLSDGEAHPLVCLEAMAAGLGLVLSEPAAGNLDLAMPFIDVIPEDKMRDAAYVNQVLIQNRAKSVSNRQAIRDYAISNFSWETIVSNYYLPNV